MGCGLCARPLGNEKRIYFWRLKEKNTEFRFFFKQHLITQFKKKIFYLTQWQISENVKEEKRENTILGIRWQPFLRFDEGRSKRIFIKKNNRKD